MRLSHINQKVPAMLTANETQAAVQFWNWFEENHLPYEFLNSMTPEQYAEAAQQLNQMVGLYCKGLDVVASLSYTSNDKFQLVITSNGDVQYFDKARALVELAPQIPNWDFYALRPPLPRSIRIQFKTDNKVLDPNDLWFSLLVFPDYPGFLGVHVALKLYDDCQEEELPGLRQIVIQLVAYIIGEESWALDIQQLRLGPLPLAPMEEDMEPLYDLPLHIAAFREEHPRPPRP